MNQLVINHLDTDKAAINILVLSDSHGDVNSVLKTIDHHLAEIDCVLFLGDGAEEIAEAAEIFSTLPFYGVTGNNDYPLPKQALVTFPLERLVSILGVNIYMTHGHLAPYSAVKNWMIKRAGELNADIALYGHLHIPDHEIQADIVRMNPGSLAYPRGGSLASYLIINITENDFTTLFYSTNSNDEITIVHK